ncbi:tripartite tricarboxylate transporter permease [Halalkalibacter krulwichiae]|uniref:Tripartite tricarboxylate transporter TctA family protein n=1 Tax=Halalkalibacter krulwichiae TaxID=199441 RepID=A0A1X9MEK7_9BACI|nr:tripartite tricarboxylate transporter permease [Halalkalibacter krulwichiae]ARK28872.1 Tripartite tricarboxylate transporter TctA family protein [Halalkalibacter krulwichiae]
MDTLLMLLNGFGEAISMQNLLAALIGAVLGIIVGSIPGLGSALGVALLLPLTFGMDPITGIIMLAAVYYGCMYGGAYSAILINIPGDSPAITTALDGYPLTKRGKSGKALFVANISSFIGGTIGIIALTFLGPVLANIGLAFGPAEVALLILLALCSVGWLLGESPAKGIAATVLGVMLATVGVDIISGQTRFTFGSENLLSGLSLIPMIIGMFGFSQILVMMTNKLNVKEERKLTLKESIPTKKEVRRIMFPSLRSGALGNFLGVLPGAGATTGGLLSYVLEKRIGKNKKEMGKGAIEGVAAAESGNNAASVGSFVPLLSLGIPGSATTAILLGGLIMWGLDPGPLLFQTNPDFVWGLISSMYIGNVISLIAGLAFIPFLMKVIKIPNSLMVPIITVVCMIGAYSVNNNMFDVWMMIIAGVIAFLLQANDYPIAPLLLAFVLTPRLEMSARQALNISNGNLEIFVSSVISIVILLLITLFIIAPPIMKLIMKRRKKNDENISL